MLRRTITITPRRRFGRCITAPSAATQHFPATAAMMRVTSANSTCRGALLFVSSGDGSALEWVAKRSYHYGTKGGGSSTTTKSPPGEWKKSRELKGDTKRSDALKNFTPAQEGLLTIAAAQMALLAGVPESRISSIHPRSVFVVKKRRLKKTESSAESPAQAILAAKNKKPSGQQRQQPQEDLYAVIQIMTKKQIAFGSAKQLRQKLPELLKEAAPVLRPVLLCAGSTEPDLVAFVNAEVTAFRGGVYSKDKSQCASIFSAPPLPTLLSKTLGSVAAESTKSTPSTPSPANACHQQHGRTDESILMEVGRSWKKIREQNGDLKAVEATMIAEEKGKQNNKYGKRMQRMQQEQTKKPDMDGSSTSKAAPKKGPTNVATIASTPKAPSVDKKKDSPTGNQVKEEAPKKQQPRSPPVSLRKPDFIVDDIPKKFNIKNDNNVAKKTPASSTKKGGPATTAASSASKPTASPSASPIIKGMSRATMNYLHSIFAETSRTSREKACADRLLDDGNLVISCVPPPMQGAEAKSTTTAKASAKKKGSPWSIGIRRQNAPSENNGASSVVETVPCLGPVLEEWTTKQQSTSCIVLIAPDLKMALAKCKELYEGGVWATSDDYGKNQQGKTTKKAKEHHLQQEGEWSTSKLRELIGEGRVHVWCLRYGKYLINAQYADSGDNKVSQIAQKHTEHKNVLQDFQFQVAQATSGSMVISISERMMSLVATHDMEFNALGVCSPSEIQELKQAVLRQSLGAKEELDNILHSHVMKPPSEIAHLVRTSVSNSTAKKDDEAGSPGNDAMSTYPENDISPIGVQNWNWSSVKNIAAVIFGGSLYSLLNGSCGTVGNMITKGALSRVHPSAVAEVDRFRNLLDDLQNKANDNRVDAGLRAVFVAAAQISLDDVDQDVDDKKAGLLALRNKLVSQAVENNLQQQQELSLRGQVANDDTKKHDNTAFEKLFEWVLQRAKVDSASRSSFNCTEEASVEAVCRAVVDSLVVVESQMKFMFAEGEHVMTNLNMFDTEFRAPLKVKKMPSTSPQLLSLDITHDGPNTSLLSLPWNKAVSTFVSKMWRSEFFDAASTSPQTCALKGCSAAAKKLIETLKLPKVVIVAVHDHDKASQWCFGELLTKCLMDQQLHGHGVCVVAAASLRKPSTSMFEDLSFAVGGSGDGGNRLQFSEGYGEKLLVLQSLGEKVGSKTDAFAMQETATKRSSSPPPSKVLQHPSSRRPRVGFTAARLMSCYPYFYGGIEGLLSRSLLPSTEVNTLRTRCSQNSATSSVQLNDKTLSIIAEVADDILREVETPSSSPATPSKKGKPTSRQTFVDALRSMDKDELQRRKVDTQSLVSLRNLLQSYRSREKDLAMVGLKNTGNFEIVNERVHHSLLHTTTATGRLSSRNPNAQSIPKTIVRRMFRSRFGANEGSIMEADFSQLEVVVLACLSKDPQMLIDLDNNVDFHCKRVSLMKPEYTYEHVKQKAKVEKDPQFVKWRQQAKVFSFQRQYGAGAKQISESTGLDIGAVNNLMTKEDAVYSGVSKYYDRAFEIVQFGHRYEKKKKPSKADGQGEAGAQQLPETPLAAPRHAFPITSGTRFNLASVATGGGRKAPILLNYPVQGFAGELVLLVLTRLHKHFAAKNNYDGKALLINTVHDCVWVDCKNEVLDEVRLDVKRIMESVPQIVMELWPEMDIGNVRFPVSVSAGPTLFDQKDLD